MTHETRMRMLLTSVAGFAAAAIVMTLAACHTVEGAGEDIESAGEATSCFGST